MSRYIKARSKAKGCQQGWSPCADSIVHKLLKFHIYIYRLYFMSSGVYNYKAQETVTIENREHATRRVCEVLCPPQQQFKRAILIKHKCQSNDHNIIDLDACHSSKVMEKVKS